MKTIKIGLIACFTFIAMTSCKKGGVFCYKADENIVTESRIVEGFTDIEIGFSADVYIEQADGYSVEIKTSKNLLEIIETNTSGSTLKIDLEKGKCIKNDFVVKIYITLPDLENILISGSSDVFVQKALNVDNLDISISGSGTVNIDSLDANSLTGNISGSGDLFLNSVNTVENQTLNISGSGTVNSTGMSALNSNIRVSGSGDCEVNAVETLNVTISGSGCVRYLGNPVIEQIITGSGSIKPF